VVGLIGGCTAARGAANPPDDREDRCCHQQRRRLAVPGEPRFSDTLAPPGGLLAPAYMAFALPMNSVLKRPLDRALTIVTANPEWRLVEETYFGRAGQ
jgi:hypothetical protein